MVEALDDGNQTERPEGHRVIHARYNEPFSLPTFDDFEKEINVLPMSGMGSRMEESNSVMFGLSVEGHKGYPADVK